MITPNIRGYLAGLLDLRGNAYVRRQGDLVVYVNGVRSLDMQRDLAAWIGGGHVKETNTQGERRGCVTHCGHPHIDFKRSSVQYVVTGCRAVVVLYTLEPSMFTWSERFATPYHRATEGKTFPRENERILVDMGERGWSIPSLLLAE